MWGGKTTENVVHELYQKSLARYAVQKEQRTNERERDINQEGGGETVYASSSSSESSLDDIYDIDMGDEPAA